jgi:hypothetical protein
VGKRLEKREKKKKILPIRFGPIFRRGGLRLVVGGAEAQMDFLKAPLGEN